jgi:hypothetical protein
MLIARSRGVVGGRLPQRLRKEAARNRRIARFVPDMIHESGLKVPVNFSSWRGGAPAGNGAGNANTLVAFRVVPTGAALGAEIRGVDFASPVPEETKAALPKAWADHMVLLWRGQRLDDEQLLATSAIFGSPHDSAARKYHLAAGHGVDDSYMVSRHPGITIISNLEAAQVRVDAPFSRLSRSMSTVQGRSGDETSMQRSDYEYPSVSCVSLCVSTVQFCFFGVYRRSSAAPYSHSRHPPSSGK